MFSLFVRWVVPVLVLCSQTVVPGGARPVGWGLGWCLFGGFLCWWVSGSWCFRVGAWWFLVFLFVVGAVGQGAGRYGGSPVGQVTGLRGG